MALLLMAQSPHNNNNNTTATTSKNDSGNPATRFHDFLGSISPSDSPQLIPNRPEEIKSHSSASDLPSGERQMRNHFQGVPLYSVAPETTSTRSLSKKRTNSDSAFMPSNSRDRGSDTLENFHLMKMLRNTMGGEHPRRSHDEEVAFAMQPPKLNSNSNSQPPVGTSVASKWERSVINNGGASTQYPSNLTQYTTYFDKERSAINVGGSRDSGAAPSIISPPAADEGSRTGMKGTGILSAINASNVVERNTPEVLISSHRLKSASVSADPDSSGPPRQSGSSSATRQMTIFYAGQAHVFDEVHPNKADMIMALAGSNGGSWSTSFSAAKSSVNPSPNQTTSIPSRDNLRRNLSMPGNSIHNRFNQGGHIGGTSLKSRRSFSQQEEANSEGNQDA